jgi:hypothetical protein
MLQVKLPQVTLPLPPRSEQLIDARHTAVETPCAVDQIHSLDNCLGRLARQCRCHPQIRGHKPRTPAMPTLDADRATARGYGHHERPHSPACSTGWWRPTAAAVLHR